MQFLGQCSLQGRNMPGINWAFYLLEHF
jgi:hypothetical protein